MSDLLVRLFGWRGALVHGNTTVIDRWPYLTRHLPRARGTGERVLDVGCGTGAFTMGMASRGYKAVGLSWDKRNQAIAEKRARYARVQAVSFPICDVRHLDKQTDLLGAFDIAICFETIEHVLDDRKLLADIYACLKPGGRLFLTTPNYYYRSSKYDMGPFSQSEDGWHVRRGYSPAMLKELCDSVGFEIEEIDYVSYMLSQVVTRLQTWMSLGPMRFLGRPLLWLLTFPLRPIPFVFDSWLGRLLSRAFGWPGYCIAISAYKRRCTTLPAKTVDQTVGPGMTERYANAS